MEVEVSKTTKSLLRFNIAGNWSANDFINFFSCINKLHKFYTYSAHFEQLLIDFKTSNIKYGDIKQYSFIWDNVLIGMFKAFSEDNLPTSVNSIQQHFTSYGDIEVPSYILLDIVRISYASPGQIVVGGIDKILKQLFNIIKYYLPNEKDKLKNDLLKQEIEILKQKKYKLFIENIKELGPIPENIDSLFLQEELQGKLLSDFITQKKITGTELKQN